MPFEKITSGYLDPEQISECLKKSQNLHSKCTVEEQKIHRFVDLTLLLKLHGVVISFFFYWCFEAQQCRGAVSCIVSSLQAYGVVSSRVHLQLLVSFELCCVAGLFQEHILPDRNPHKK